MSLASGTVGKLPGSAPEVRRAPPLSYSLPTPSSTQSGWGDGGGCGLVGVKEVGGRWFSGASGMEVVRWVMVGNNGNQRLHMSE